jgi:hypothetical protein
MKPVCSTFYDAARRRIIAQYPRFKTYFEDLKRLIETGPMASREEIIIYAGKPRHVRKRYIKTTFFSGLLPDTYKYLTITYGITTHEQIVFMFANLRDFID